MLFHTYLDFHLFFHDLVNVLVRHVVVVVFVWLVVVLSSSSCDIYLYESDLDK